MKEVRDGVWRANLPVLPTWRVNVYLVEYNDVTLVDAGVPWTAGKLRRELRSEGFEVGDIDRVLLTHYDLDHFGGLLRLPALDAEVYAGVPDAGYLSGAAKPPLLHHKGAFHRLLGAVLPSLDVTPLGDGETVGGFTAYHSPGHNPGHMVYVHDGVETAFLGDLVWEQDGRLTPPVWMDSYDLGELRESVRRLAGRVSFQYACMGHGEPLNDGERELERLAGEIRNIE